MAKIVVIGSINIDLVTTCEHFPTVGESMFGQTFAVYCGGKGANQAVCAAKLGAEVTMVGCIGNDANGETAIKNLAMHQINTAYVQRVSEPTGVALIIVAQQDNEIVVIKGANACVTPEVVDLALPAIKQADMIMLQLEIPLKTVEYVVDLAAVLQKPVMLNPAPYQPIEADLINKVTYLTPNQIEVRQIFGEDYSTALAHYPNKVIMTAGSSGVYFHDGHELGLIPAHEVKVVDTTGAGDTFNGALAVALVSRMSLRSAIDFAQKAAGIAIGKMGAQTAMPILTEMQ
ncbi:MAG: ribokinase [Erysipelotrichaceae bacterium]|nr:ribokinase [Erysipelotrichaceae bacterium]